MFICAEYLPTVRAVHVQGNRVQKVAEVTSILKNRDRPWNPEQQQTDFTAPSPVKSLRACSTQTIHVIFACNRSFNIQTKRAINSGIQRKHQLFWPPMKSWVPLLKGKETNCHCSSRHEQSFWQYFSLIWLKWLKPSNTSWRITRYRSFSIITWMVPELLDFMIPSRANKHNPVGQATWHFWRPTG